jgi:murein DD-endopeptidase MepM/ murein hydrolase activator NlpD
VFTVTTWMTLLVLHAPAQQLPDVAPRIVVALSARAWVPGEVVRVEVTAPAAVTAVRVTVFGRTVTAGHEGASWRVLVGIDLDTSAGDYPMLVEAALPSGVTATERRVITIGQKEFPTRLLRVNPRFVTPPRSVRPRIEREAATLAEIFAAEDDEPRWPGMFVVPIDGAVVSGFGVRSVFNGEPRAAHGGADFASPTGTPVAAPGDGIVVLAAELYFTGSTIVLAHGGGVYSLLAHLSRRDVTTGEAVTRGQVVGAVGATGRATGPHLHWTVRLHTARVDPLSLVAATEAGPPRPATSSERR